MVVEPHLLLRWLKPGDGLIILLGLLFTLFLAASLWNGDLAESVIIRSGGKVFREVPLTRDTFIDVPGPLGISQIAIQQRQARIASDPSPRQYCVRQGWLKNAGDMAICLPNEVSIELTGGQKRYDSLNY